MISLYWLLPPQHLFFGGPLYTGSFCGGAHVPSDSSLGQDLKGFKPVLPPCSPSWFITPSTSDRTTHRPSLLTHSRHESETGLLPGGVTPRYPDGPREIALSWLENEWTPTPTHWERGRREIKMPSPEKSSLQVLAPAFTPWGWRSWKLWNWFLLTLKFLEIVYWQQCYLISTASGFLAETSNLKSFYTCVCWMWFFF